MGIIELKEKLHLQIEVCDESVLHQIAAFLDNSEIEERDEDSLLIQSLLEKSEHEYLNGEFESKEKVLNEARSKYLKK